MSAGGEMCDDPCSLLEPGVQIRPVMTHQHVVTLSLRLYGLTDVSITEFNSYDDKNYHIQEPGKDVKERTHEHGYVLKVTNSLDSKKLEFIEAQNEMMLYLDEHGIRCPKPVKNLNGRYCSAVNIYRSDDSTPTVTHSEHVVRLLTYLPGTILHKVPCTSELFYKVGKHIAEIDNVLKGFQHPAYETRKSIWFLEALPELRKFLFAVEDKERLQLVTQTLEAFETEVMPVIPDLERGVLHGDFNEQNILVQEDQENRSWEICAVLDFGDTNVSCYLFELAITVCYMMTTCKEGDVFDAAGQVLAGYSAVRPIPDKEFRLLKTCISSRLCQSLVMGAYSHLQDPENDYVLTSQEVGWRLLARLAATPQADLEQRWRRIIASYQV